MDSEDTPLAKLIRQCQSNDGDVKIDGLFKLQNELESGTPIEDVDGVINVLKSCLRTSNQHLTAATLAALPSLIPIILSNPTPTHQHGAAPSVSTSTRSVASTLVDVHSLRQCVMAFLPTGGLIDRLGDKERNQLKARESLTVLGGLAFRSGAGSHIPTGSNGSRGGKVVETPLALFERFLKDSGLASKVWKVREQCLWTLVHIRRKHHQFPIRPYLPLMVDALEDTDAHVRDCARLAIVELFSGPAATDGARTDLKKEMTKKGVRKTIVEGVLAKLLGGNAGSSAPQSREGSENGDIAMTSTASTKGYIPPSIALGRKASAASGKGISRTVSQSSVREIPRAVSRAGTANELPLTPTAESAEVKSVYIASARDMENEFSGMAKAFDGKETEHNWAAREQSIIRVRGMLKGEIHLRYLDTFLACLKDNFIQWSFKTVVSLRTTVAAHTCSLYAELAVALGTHLDPFCEPILSTLLKMSGYTKKIIAQQSQASVTSVITLTTCPPRVVIPLLWQTLQEKTAQARAFVAGHIKTYLEVHGQKSKHAIEATGTLETLAKSLKKTLADANPAVKETARSCYWVFEKIWTAEGLAILETLDASGRKQLEKACPDPKEAVTLPLLSQATLNTQKKSSVAAAIAASRAKAKAIAVSPPTLRHQATSASHTPVRRAGSPSPITNKTLSPRPSSPLRNSTSSPSARSLANGSPRSVSSGAVPVTPKPKRYSSTAPSPPSSGEEHPSFPRRATSPLAATSPSTIRKAVRTALPASPVSEVKRTKAAPVRESTAFMDNDDDSLLMAQGIPIPENDSESDEMDYTANLLSFSAAFDKSPAHATPAAARPASQALSFSPQSSEILVSNTRSSDSVAALTEAGNSQPAVEDALRARAEQAESAAERLLELVDPEEEGMQHSTIPQSLLIGSVKPIGSGISSTPKVKTKPTPLPIGEAKLPPVTPINNRGAAILRQAALFRDSPAYNPRATSLLDVLQDKKHETGWWLKRKAFLAANVSQVAATPMSPNRVDDLKAYIARLHAGIADVEVLQQLALLCMQNRVVEAVSPISNDFNFPASPSPFIEQSNSMPSLHSDMWEQDKNFDKLFNALIQFLSPSKSEEEIEFGLILLWEMLENQPGYLEGHEAEIFSLLLQIRYCNKTNVLEATNTIRDALTTRIEPVYGLTTMHGSLRAFHSETTAVDEEVKAATYAFGLMGLGKFILRLPAEIAEEELPRLKATLITSLNDKSSLVVRESAAATIIAAQLVLRDETQLFLLLDGLADEKKNLLTYLFDKHAARGVGLSVQGTGLDKLEKEMRRLDTRTSTPPRPPTVTPHP